MLPYFQAGLVGVIAGSVFESNTRVRVDSAAKLVIYWIYNVENRLRW